MSWRRSTWAEGRKSPIAPSIQVARVGAVPSSASPLSTASRAVSLHLKRRGALRNGSPRTFAVGWRHIATAREPPLDRAQLRVHGIKQPLHHCPPCSSPIARPARVPLRCAPRRYGFPFPARVSSITTARSRTILVARSLSVSGAGLGARQQIVRGHMRRTTWRPPLAPRMPHDFLMRDSEACPDPRQRFTALQPKTRDLSPRSLIERHAAPMPDLE